MWRTVDNALSAHPRTAKVEYRPVDNECGQMCTKSHSVDRTPLISTRKLVSFFERFFCPKSVENSDFVVTIPRPVFVFGICRELRSFHTECGMTVDSIGVALLDFLLRTVGVFVRSPRYGASHASSLVWGSHVRPREHSRPIALRRSEQGTRELSPLAQDRLVAD